jgi:SAM-dependent methyltransferase
MSSAPQLDIRFTGERYVPGQSPADNFYQAFHRYRFLASHPAFGGLVIDAGSGTGAGAALIARSGATVVGLEIDAESTAFGYRRYENSNLPLRLCRADVARMPIVSGVADWVVAFETIEHIQEPERLIDEAHRVLRMGGSFVASTPIAPAERYRDNPFHVRVFTAEQLVELICKTLRVEALYYQGMVTRGALVGLMIKHQIRRPLRGLHALEIARSLKRRFVRTPQTVAGSEELEPGSETEMDSRWQVRPLSQLPGSRMPYVMVVHAVKP